MSLLALRQCVTKPSATKGISASTLTRNSSGKTHISNSLKVSSFSSHRVSSFHSSSSRFSESKSEDETTHFGFKTVNKSEKADLVGHIFHNVAEKYDLMNDLMSAGVHRLWKNEFVEILNPTPGMKVVDVAGGTGDIAFRIAEAMKSSSLSNPSSELSKVIVCDINPSMLAVGRSRSIEKKFSEEGEPSINWVAGDAESLPLPDASVDAFTIAFGIRNCTHPHLVVREAFRVLKPGGRFMCLEFSHIESLGAGNSVGQAIYDAYSFNIIPKIGEVVANDKDSYQYLVESIRKFPKQNEFCEIIEKEGFSHVSYKNLTLGVAAIHSAFKI